VSLPPAAAAALAPLVDRPTGAGVVVDFDGTLAPIVTDPARARPAEGAVDALAALVPRVALVAVVSGRPVDFLLPLMPAGVVLSGVYGLETVRDGRRADLPGATAWREVVTEVVRRAAAGPDGMEVEPKGLSLTLHFRAHPGAGPAVVDWARAEADRSGLVARHAKMSVELHPPVDTDKGTALEALAAGLGAVMYVGDDHGDLPAFDGLDRLASRGVATVRVAVASAEVPAELVARADLVLDGPPAVVELLRALA
jgi:trehalose 6-phosphate phosphatase